MVHAGLPGAGAPAAAAPGGGGELCEGPPAGWLVVVDTLPPWGGHQVRRLGLAAPTEAGGASLVESVDVEPGDKHGVGERSHYKKSGLIPWSGAGGLLTD